MPSLRKGCVAALIAAAAWLALLPAAAQSPVPATPKQPTPAQAAPAPAKPQFGEEVVLPPRKIVYLKGEANWDRAFDTLVDAYKSVYGYLKEQGLQPAGKGLTIYTQADDTGFSYRAAVPITAEPKSLPKGDLQIGLAPAGKALKFVHRGSYDDMDATYEAVTNYLDEKNIEADDVFIEEYETDLTQTPADRLVVNIYVPIK